MDFCDNQTTALFLNDLFRQVANNIPISLCSFNLLTNFLVSICFPFDVSFVPGTRKEAAAFQLTIHINPTRTEVFVVALMPGSTTFAPSP